jgi:hypothetical protein
MFKNDRVTSPCDTPGFTLEGDLGKEVTLWELTSLSRWSKAKFKSPCNFEELLYVARVFLPRVIKENVYWNLSYPLSILKVIFLKSNPFQFKET